MTIGWGSLLKPRDIADAYNAGSVKREASGAYRNQDYVEKIQRFGGFA